MHLAIPKGRLYRELEVMLQALGLSQDDPRRYTKQTPYAVCKYLKVQDIPQLLHLGCMDLGFVSHEWVVEHGADIEPLVTFPVLPCHIAAIIAQEHHGIDALEDFLPMFAGQPVRVVSPYANMTRRFLDAAGVPYTLLPIVGSSEAFVPELADLVVDCVETGNTIRSNGLKVVGNLLFCSVYLAANKAYLRAHPEEVAAFVNRVEAARGEALAC